MNQLEFEGLVNNIFSILPIIKDEESLLKTACSVLKTEAAVLISCPRNSAPVMLAHYPSELKILKEEINSLREWYSKELPESDGNGFIQEKSLKGTHWKFADAMVSLGIGYKQANSERRELILLGNVEPHRPFSSYLTWAAARLLEKYELLKNTEDLTKCASKLEKHQDERAHLTSAIGKEILPDVNWQDLENQVKDWSPGLMWTAYITWLVYQSRHSKLGQPVPDLKLALEDSTIKSGAPESIKAQKPLFNKFIEIISGKSENPSSLLKELTDSFAEVSPKPWKDEENQISSQLSVLGLELGWKFIARAMSTGLDKHGMLSIQDIIRLVNDLMGHTRTVIIKRLCPDDGDNPKTKNLEIGRRFLRLLFAIEIIAPGSRLAQLYLDAERKAEFREAPPELQQLFLLNLSRFMLGVIANLQNDFGLRGFASHTLPGLVTADEELDGLLYVLDRFVHVELGVDERFHIRNHLARQIGTEVQHYLTRPYYRDHLLHVIDVFLLGDILLKTNVYWTEQQKRTLLEHIEYFASHSGNTNDSNCKFTDKHSCRKNWAVASLMHDIGYQVSRGKDVSLEPKVWKDFFALPGDKEMAWLDFSKFQSPENPSKPDILNALEKSLDKLAAKDMFDVDHLTDHGVLSALRIAQIASLAHSNGVLHEEKGKALYAPAIHAVANHNLFESRLAFKEHPLSCLLRICDELQEWGRTQVNMEKMLKGLYLDLQNEYTASISNHQMLSSFKTNLKIKESQGAKKQEIEVFLPDGGQPHFFFELEYNDCSKARFDPTMTALCKFYNLQHINLEVQGKQSQEQIQIRIALKFPLPDGYKGLSEYDFYALFSNNVRNLPLLRQFNNADKAEAGFVRLKPESEQNSNNTDGFGIIMSGSVAPDSLNGWLTINPAVYFDMFIRFKADLLASKRL